MSNQEHKAESTKKEILSSVAVNVTNSKDKWTPGPWRVDVQGSHGDQVFSAEGMIVADCKWTAEIEEKRCANARLIAESPTLLKVLEDLTDAFADYGGPTYAPVYKSARAAISRARGTL